MCGRLTTLIGTKDHHSMWFLGEFWQPQSKLQVTELNSCSRVLGFLGWDALTLLLYTASLTLCMSVSVLVTQPWPTHCNSMDCSPSRLLCPWDFLGKNTEVGCHFLLQRIFLTQGSNSDLLHCRQILYHLSYQESKLTVVHNTTTMYYCSCLENSMDIGTWHGFARCWPRLSTSASAHVLLLTSVIISHTNAKSLNPHQNQSSS